MQADKAEKPPPPTQLVTLLMQTGPGCVTVTEPASAKPAVRLVTKPIGLATIPCGVRADRLSLLNNSSVQFGSVWFDLSTACKYCYIWSHRHHVRPYWHLRVPGTHVYSGVCQPPNSGMRMRALQMCATPFWGGAAACKTCDGCQPCGMPARHCKLQNMLYNSTETFTFCAKLPCRNASDSRAGRRQALGPPTGAKGGTNKHHTTAVTGPAVKQGWRLPRPWHCMGTLHPAHVHACVMNVAHTCHMQYASRRP
jgi:hypothetical protein